MSPLGGTGFKRWIRAPARPSVLRAKSAVFARSPATCGGGAHPVPRSRAVSPLGVGRTADGQLVRASGAPALFFEFDDGLAARHGDLAIDDRTFGDSDDACNNVGLDYSCRAYFQFPLNDELP